MQQRTALPLRMMYRQRKKNIKKKTVVINAPTNGFDEHLRASPAHDQDSLSRRIVVEMARACVYDQTRH